MNVTAGVDGLDPMDAPDPADAALVDALAAGGAPVGLATAVRRALGRDAAPRLDADPWLLLRVLGVRPDQADAYARRRLGGAARPEDGRRAVALVGWLLERAARDGHTLQPLGTLRSTLAGLGVEAADAALRVAVASGVARASDVGVALARFADAERRVATAVARRAAAPATLRVVVPAAGGWVEAVSGAVRETAESGRTAAVVAPDEPGTGWLQERLGLPVRTVAALVASPPEADRVVVAGAAALGVVASADLLDAVPAAGELVLVGDPAELPSRDPGRFLADLAEGIPELLAPAGNAAAPAEESAIARLAAGVRAGRLPPVPELDVPGYEVVVVPAKDSCNARHRVLQLVTDSIPRVLSVAPADVVVVTVRESGAAGVRALRVALAEHGSGAEAVRVGTVPDLRSRRWPAVVAVFAGEAAGSLSRALVYTVCGLVERHLSVVHTGGAALPAAVSGADRGRRTGLPALIRAARASS